MATIFDTTSMQEIWRRVYERGFKESKMKDKFNIVTKEDFEKVEYIL